MVYSFFLSFFALHVLIIEYNRLQYGKSNYHQCKFRNSIHQIHLSYFFYCRKWFLEKLKPEGWFVNLLSAIECKIRCFLKNLLHTDLTSRSTGDIELGSICSSVLAHNCCTQNLRSKARILSLII